MQATKIYLFYCNTSLGQIEMEQVFNELEVELKTIPLPCSGKVDILYLAKAFESGADGAVIVTCKQGECRYLEGNLRAKKRASAIETLLEEIGLGQGRMAIVQMSDGGIKQVINDLKDFINRIIVLPVAQHDTDIPLPKSDGDYPHVVAARKENR